MALTSGELRVLHRIHRQLSDLRDRLDRGPKQIRARDQNVKTLDEDLTKAQHDAQQARMTADKKQLDLKSSEDKILDLKRKLNSCSTNKEYQALLDQIAAAEMAGSVLSDEILEALERIDELDKVIDEAKEKVAKARIDLEKTKQHVAETNEVLTADVTRLEAQRADAESALPADVRVDYLRVVRAKGEDGLAPAEAGYCGGCNQQITPNMENNLALGKVVFCLTCGRLLYLPE